MPHTASSYEVIAGTATDAYVPHPYTTPRAVTEVTIWDNALMVEYDVGGGFIGAGEIEYDPNVQSYPYPEYLKVKSIQLKNKTAGWNSRYQFVGLL